MKFFEFFAKRHLFANLFTILVMALGIKAVYDINRNMFPEVDMGEMVITTVYPGASPEDVELKITNKLEDELEGISGIRSYVSTSMENRSQIRIKLEPDEESDHDKIKQEIRDAINQVSDLPTDIEELPRIVEIKTSVFPVAEIAIISSSLDYRSLRTYVKAFEDRLKEIPEISKISKYGWQDREVRVEVKPEKLSEYQVSLSEIITAIDSRNIRLTGGSFESYTGEKDIVTLAQFKDPKEVGDVIVRSTFNGPSIRIKGLAEVKDDFEKEDVLSRVNGKKAISLIPYKGSSSDVIKTVDKIKKLIEEESSIAPSDIEFIVANDSSHYVRNRFKIVVTNGALGLVFIVFFLAVFLNWRTAFWVSVSIPFMLLGVIFLLNAFGMSLDAIMLMGMIIILGIVVDDAIIISESIYRERELGAAPLDAAVRGISKVFAPVLTTIITTFMAFSTMFFMPGVMGKFCRVIPLTITLALIVSLLEVIVALPAHLVPGLKKEQQKKSTTNWFDGVRRVFIKFMRTIMPLRYFMVLLFVGILASALFYAKNNIPIEIFPKKAADTFNIEIELPLGTSLKATADKIVPIEKIVSTLPKDIMDAFATRVGLSSTDGVSSEQRENNAVISVFLKPFGERGTSVFDTVASLREQTDKLEGFKKISYKIQGAGPPVGKPITLRVISPDDAQRKTLADRVEQKLDSIQGVKDITRDDIKGKQQVEIKIDYDLLARSELSVSDVAQTVRIAYDGQVVTSVRYGDEDVDYRVVFTDQARMDKDFLKKILIRNKNGKLIELGRVAKFVTVDGPSNFYHYNSQRTITVNAEVQQGTVEPLKVANQVMDSIDLKQEFRGARLVLDGEAEETKQSMISWGISLLISVVGIYFILVILFNSFLQPLLVLSAVPFGLSGVIFAVAWHGQSISFFSMLGVIGLVGVVVNDSLVLVNHLNKLREENPDMSVLDIATVGTGDRLRAIIMTSITTIAGLLPLAYGIGGVDPFVGYMALALAWGLFLATPLTLILIPSLYLIGNDINRLCNYCLKRTS